MLYVLICELLTANCLNNLCMSKEFIYVIAMVNTKQTKLLSIILSLSPLYTVSRIELLRFVGCFYVYLQFCKTQYSAVLNTCISTETKKERKTERKTFNVVENVGLH